MNLQDIDIKNVLRVIPPIVKDLLIRFKAADDIPAMALAGGFIRDTISNSPPKDIDLFVIDSETRLKVVDRLKLDKHEVLAESSRPNSHEFTTLQVGNHRVQVIHGYIRQLDKDGAHSWFDYTSCQASIWADKDEKWVGKCCDGFYPAIANRRLEYNSGCRTPMFALRRMLRFIARGYKPTDNAIISILTDILTHAINNNTTSESAKVVIEQMFCGLEIRVPGTKEEYTNLGDADEFRRPPYPSCDS
jgi:hypothetical protein